ncbi:hypothetical protein V6N11_034305 [Hibiscus sabdariffa]|uniref:Uncharacterized protein n=1 Tax=Hibiscus sabdariffa TaxID=183260 RepID=A0ABR1ZYT9_9ROSI
MPIGVTLLSHPEFDTLGVGNERALLGTLSKPGRNVEVSPHLPKLFGLVHTVLGLGRGTSNVRTRKESGLGLCRGHLPRRRSYASPAVVELNVPVHTHFKFTADGGLYHTK